MLAAALAAAGSLRPLQPEQEAGSLVPLQPEQESRGGGGSSSGDAHGDGAAGKLLARAKPGEAAGVQNFVIFSRARSGTTWLISMLNGHPEISCDGELLLKVKTDGALTQFYEAFDRSGRLHEGTKAREQSKRRVGAQGFKWFHYQAGIELFEPYYNWNLDNASRARYEDRAQEWAAWLQRNHFKVVVFEREDRLARMVSEAKHNMLKDYMCATEKCVDEHRKKKVYLKPEHLKLKLRDDEEIGTSTVGWLNQHGFNGSQVRRARCPTACSVRPRLACHEPARPPPAGPASRAENLSDVPRAGQGPRGAGEPPVPVPGRRPEAASQSQRDHEDGHGIPARGRDRKPARGRGGAAGNQLSQGALRPAVLRLH
jgi:hypothetical protein